MPKLIPASKANREVVGDSSFKGPNSGDVSARGFSFAEFVTDTASEFVAAYTNKVIGMDLGKAFAEFYDESTRIYKLRASDGGSDAWTTASFSGIEVRVELNKGSRLSENEDKLLMTYKRVSACCMYVLMSAYKKDVSKLPRDRVATLVNPMYDAYFTLDANNADSIDCAVKLMFVAGVEMLVPFFKKPVLIIQMIKSYNASVMNQLNASKGIDAILDENVAQISNKVDAVKAVIVITPEEYAAARKFVVEKYSNGSRKAKKTLSLAEKLRASASSASAGPISSGLDF